MDPNQQNPMGVVGMTQQQMIYSLQELMGNIESEYKNFKSQQTASQDGLKLNKSDVLQQLYDLFQTQGVDPSNPQAVGQLLNKVQTNNPDLYRQIEQSLQQILGSDETPAQVNTNLDPSVAGSAISTTDDSTQTTDKQLPYSGISPNFASTTTTGSPSFTPVASQSTPPAVNTSNVPTSTPTPSLPPTNNAATSPAASTASSAISQMRNTGGPTQ